MPPTRLGHMSTSSIQPGVAAQLSRSPTMSRGTAPVPWLATRAPMRNRLWLLPPIASALVPNQPSVRGWSVGGWPIHWTGRQNALPLDRAPLPRGAADGRTARAAGLGGIVGPARGEHHDEDRHDE